MLLASRTKIKATKEAKEDKGSKTTISSGRATVKISRREEKVAKRAERTRKVMRRITTMR